MDDVSASGRLPDHQRSDAFAAASHASTEPETPDYGGGRLRHALRRRWHAALAVGLGAAAVTGFLVYQAIDPTYQAQAVVRLLPQEQRLVFDLPGQGLVDYEAYRETQAAVLRSPDVLQTVLAEPEVASLALVARHAHPLVWLRSSIEIGVPYNSELLEIDVTTTEARASEAIANAVARVYSEGLYRQQQEEYRRRIELVTAERDARRQAVDERRQALAEAAAAAGLWRGNVTDAAGAEAELTLLLGEVRELQTRSATLEASRAAAAAEVARLTEQLQQGVPVSPLSVETRIQEDSVVQLYVQSIVQAEVQLDRLRSRLRDEQHPSIVQASEQLAQLREGLEERRRQITPAVEQGLRAEAARAHEDRLAVARQTLEQLDAQLASAEAELEQAHARSRQMSEALAELRRLAARVTEAEQLLAPVEERLAALRVESQASGRAVVLQWADAAGGAERSYRREKYAGALAILALFGAAGLVLWRDLLQQRAGSPEEIVAAVRPALVATVPAEPGRGRSSARQARPTSRERAYWSSIDTLRAVLREDVAAGRMRRMLVTSAVAGEGKTTLSARLAESFARAGVRTLLVDADFYSPDLHGRFGLAAEPGFADVLAGRCAPGDAIRESAVEGLALLPAGHVSDEPARLIERLPESAECREAFERFELVIFDGPPVLPAPEALTLARSADRVVLATLRDVTRKPLVQLASSRLASVGRQPDCLIMGGVPAAHAAGRTSVARGGDVSRDTRYESREYAS